MLLLLSGLSITWAHKSIIEAKFKYTIDALFITLFLGTLPLYFQLKEYRASNSNFTDGAFSCTFSSLTGSHGCHVFVGIISTFVSFIRSLRRHFTVDHHLGFVTATWYRHFVDATRILPYSIVYFWITVY
jgi:cytochrome c oxidase subunit 3